MTAEEQAAAAASAAQATPAAPAAGEKPAVVVGKDGTPFDPERAQATIDALREKEKAGDAAVKELARIQKEQGDAETERLRTQGEFEKLATTAATERDEARTTLGTVTQERDDAFKLLQADADKRVAALPEAVRNRVPSAKDASPLERLAKVAELEELAKALAPAKPSTSGPLRGAVAAGNHAEGAQQGARQPQHLGIV